MCDRWPLARIQHRIRDMAVSAKGNPHHVLFGATGSGKSHLIRHGILPVYALARVVVIDAKGGRDSVWDGWGTPVDELPERFGDRATDATGLYFRLIVSLRTDAKDQILRALEQVRDEGHCVLVLDETRTITEARKPGYGLGPMVDSILSTSRSSGITVISGSQSTAWATSAVKDQAGTVWCGKMTYVPQAKELANVTGDPALWKEIGQTRDQDWLYSDRHGSGLLARTSVA